MQLHMTGLSQFPFVKSFCCVFIIYSPSLKHEMWLGTWPSQLCNHVSSKCAVCSSYSISISLKSKLMFDSTWHCILRRWVEICSSWLGRINAVSLLNIRYSTGLTFMLCHVNVCMFWSSPGAQNACLEVICVYPQNEYWTAIRSMNFPCCHNCCLNAQIAPGMEGLLLMIDGIGLPLYVPESFGPDCWEQQVW